MSDSLLDALHELQSADLPIKSACNTALLLAELPEETAAKLLQLIDDPRISTPRLAEALHAQGHRIGDDSLLRHRNRSTGRGCKCPR